MKNSSWLVIFEGQDETGKSSILREFNKQTNFKHTVVDRGFISTAVYSIKFNRNNDAIDSLNNLIEVSKHINVLIVLCEADTDTILKRLSVSDKKDYISDEQSSLIDEISSDREFFRVCIALCKKYCHVLIINTSLYSAKDRASIVVNHIKLLEDKE